MAVLVHTGQTDELTLKRTESNKEGIINTNRPIAAAKLPMDTDAAVTRWFTRWASVRGQRTDKLSSTSDYSRRESLATLLCPEQSLCLAQ